MTLQDTSLEAYEFIQPKIGPLQRLAFNLIAESPNGISGVEVSWKTRLERTTICPRITELKDLGLVQDSGRRLTMAHGKRSTHSIVWILTDLGKRRRDQEASP